jgi:hypothetical protein
MRALFVRLGQDLEQLLSHRNRLAFVADFLQVLAPSQEQVMTAGLGTSHPVSWNLWAPKKTSS